LKTGDVCNHIYNLFMLILMKKWFVGKLSIIGKTLYLNNLLLSEEDSILFSYALK